MIISILTELFKLFQEFCSKAIVNCWYLQYTQSYRVPATHHSQLYSGGEVAAIEECLYDHDDGRRQRLDDLVRSDGVSLQREIREDDEAAEGRRDRYHLSER